MSGISKYFKDNVSFVLNKQQVQETSDDIVSYINYVILLTTIIATSLMFF